MDSMSHQSSASNEEGSWENELLGGTLSLTKHYV